MRDLFEKYVTMFYFDGKEFWFDWFLEIDKKLCFKDFEKMKKWFEENQESANSILEKNREKISKIKEEYLRLPIGGLESLTFALPTLKNMTTGVGGMFDET